MPNVTGLFLYLHLIVMFSGILQKDLLKGRLSLVESSTNSHFQNEAKKIQRPYVNMTKFRQYLVTGGVRLHEISVC